MSSADAAARTETQTVSPVPPQQVHALLPAHSGENVLNTNQPSTTTVNGRVNSAEKLAEGQGGETTGAGPSCEVTGAVHVGAADHLEGAEQTGDDSGQWSDDESHDLKRVKVYQLIANRWVDQGTAFCFGDFQDNEALLVARAEADFNHIILSTVIRSSDVYQLQQDTLIVWTEPDGNDYALSFQDPDGCAEVWQFIQEVQRHMNSGEDPVLSSSPLMGHDQSITTASIIRSGHLPQPQLGIIGEIEKAIKALSRTNALKERICEYIQTEDYIRAMIDVMHQAEDLENLENLHALCSCMQAILMLNDHSLYEHILEDDLFFGVVGMLEYDPEFPTHKANYRDFLRQTSQFHQPIPLGDETIQKKIHHTYRLQFLKDVVLARAIDDSTFNVLNSCIIFNQIDIINYVQNDPSFLPEVVATFMDDELLAAVGLPAKSREPEKEKNSQMDSEKMDVDQPEAKTNGAVNPIGIAEGAPSSAPPSSDDEFKRRCEVVLLIQQLCAMGKNVQLPARMTLFRALVERGIVFAVQWGLDQSETEENGRQMIAASGEILTALLDHDVGGVRTHVMKQLTRMEHEKASGKKIVAKETVLELMCRILVRSRDLAVQSQVGEALKLLLETQQDSLEQHAPPGTKTLQRPKDEPNTERFLDFFYKHCIGTLFRPLDDIPVFSELTEPVLVLSRERANLYFYLCDLLSTFILQHSFRSHFYILSSDISLRVASLLSARDKHLRLAAFRVFRTCLKLNNPGLFNQLISKHLFKPILDLTLRESHRDNLLSASCQEFFEHMRKENLKDLIAHCMTVYGPRVRELAESPMGGPRFKAFIRRWEMNVEPPPEEEKPEKLPLNGPRRWGEGRLLEAEEEDYFNADDDDDEIVPVVSTPPRGNALKRKRMRGMGPSVRSIRPFTPLPRTPPLARLVDYDEGDNLGGPVEDSPMQSSPSISKTASTSSGYFPLSSPSVDGPPSSRMIRRSLVKPSSFPDEQGDLLESLFTRSGSSSGLTGPPELGAKRRREDEDDELLERLASRSKRTSVGPGPSPEKENADSPVAGKAGLAKPIEESPKKMKVKIGSLGAALASSSPSTSVPPAPSRAGTKDGDNG
ncbi:component of IIS longevity pathway SMK-1-domain-containing protein [Sparassis latifolia]